MTWKVVLSSLVVSAAIGSQAAAGPFDGFYVGGQVGYEIASVDIEISDGVDATSIDGASLDGVGGGLFAGFGHVTEGRTYFGVEGFANLQAGENTIADTLIGGSIDTETDWSWGAGARVGFLSDDYTLLYLKAQYARQRYESDGTSAGLGSREEWLDGFGVGGGVELAFAAGFHWRLDVTHYWYDEVEIDYGAGIVGTYEPTGLSVMMGVSFALS